METMTLQAEVRTESGKGPARRLRASGKIPAVVYGPGIDPTPLTVNPTEILKGLRSKRGRNVAYDLTFGGKQALVMVRDLEVDPVSRELLHVDFLSVAPEVPVKVSVPLSTTGRAKGVVKGGLLNVTLRTVPLLSPPKLVPEEIVLDVTGLDVGESIVVKDLQLAEGVVCALPADRTLVSIQENRRAIAAAEAAAAAAAAAPAAKKKK
ncbi:MAG: 50S ribosomal protein L25 [Myxococcales bacterium]|nr:50S ribosomal protein L25 [Myxococcales bacterium]MCB9629236.1 50S ribosomal protein L25 [Sandaracinaceae bacterium]